jgi:type III secretion protein U
MSEGSEAKKHAASDTKLRKQRKEGSIANSQESTGFMACAFGIGLVASSAGLIWEKMQSMITTSIDQITLPFDEAREVSLSALGQAMFSIILPVVGIVIGTAFVAAVILNKGIIFAMKPVTPQMSRVSPSAGFKRIYGRKGLIETPISAIRICMWLAFATFLGFWPTYALVGEWACGSHCMADQLTPVFNLLVIGAVIAMLLAAGADIIAQRTIFLHDQKMTDTERKNERKDQFGSAEVRQERRRLMREASQPRRQPKLANATMCFYFGEHAVAIEFRPPEVAMPHVVAKAVNAKQSVALRKRVTDKGWPERKHDALTRAGMTTALGEVIGEDAFDDFIEAVQGMFG